MKKSKGLGDTIETITTITGIKSVVHFLFGDDCGCDERKEKLNKIFPYARVECLTEAEYEYLRSFDFNTNTLTSQNQLEIVRIYNRVFNERQQLTSCVKCWQNIIEKLRILYEEYKITG